MGDKDKETKKESPKPEAPEKINIATPRPSDKKVLNNSLSEGSYAQFSNIEEDDD